MRAILGAALTVVLVMTAAGAADEKIDGKLLVGKWQPKEAKDGPKFVVELTKDGKLSFTGDGDFKAEGTYKLDGNKLHLKVKFGDQEQEKTRTISKLTADELVSSDEKGKEDTLVRVKK